MNNSKFSEVGSVVMEFVIDDQSVLPKDFPQLPDEMLEEREFRHSRRIGDQSILKKVKQVIARPFVKTLFETGFSLVGAWSQRRFFYERRSYIVSRFKFTQIFGEKHQSLELLNTYFDTGSVPYQVLMDLCDDYMWNVGCIQSMSDPDERVVQTPWVWNLKLSGQRNLAGQLATHYLVIEDFGSQCAIPKRVTTKRYQEQNKQNR